MTPTVGRIVHYVAYGSAGGEYPSVCRAATVAEVGAWATDPGQGEPVEWESADGARRRQLHQVWQPEACALVVTNPTGLFFNTCPHDEDGHAGGIWHWPERAEG